MAPSCIALRTRDFIAASWSGVGWTSSSPSTFTRTVSAPTNEATFRDMPFLTMACRPPSSVVQVTGNLMSCWRWVSSACIFGVSGPMDDPSPMTSSVTPWRSSERPRPSAIRLASEWLSMLMNPGARALPRASISTLPRPGAWAPTKTIRSPLIAISPTNPLRPEPSSTSPPRMTVSYRAGPGLAAPMLAAASMASDAAAKCFMRPSGFACCSRRIGPDKR